MGDPIPGKWLSEGFDQFVIAVPELAAAYDYPSYPAAMVGPGRWVDLYADLGHATPVGRLWTNENDGCGVEQLPGLNTDIYTREVLQIRLFHHAGQRASAAFVDVLSRYPHDPIHSGDLRAATPRSNPC